MHILYICILHNYELPRKDNSEIAKKKIKILLSRTTSHAQFQKKLVVKRRVQFSFKLVNSEKANIYIDNIY